LSTVYGPVPSWRFGRSLGIDVIMGPKMCTFNCVYCQLGKTGVKISDPSDVEGYVSVEAVEKHLKRCVNEVDLSSIDVITFSGSGEPTLNPDLGKTVDRVRRLIGEETPIVLLTNSSLFYKDKVRENVSKFDVVVAKLDAGDEKAYRTISRPIGEMPNLEKIKESIKKLKGEMSGKLMIQTMFLHTTFGFTNCEGDTLKNLINTLIDIEPDVIQVDTPYRPGGEKFVKPASVDELKTIARKFEEYFEKEGRHNDLWVFGVHDMRGRKVSWTKHASIPDEIMGLLKRRPCRAVDMADSLGISYKETLENLRELLGRDLIVEKTSNGEKYYQPSIRCV
jgi:wyosine [tRNA(Phe)-imidazoG37] synthetase (radical SAM superfamily)